MNGLARYIVTRIVSGGQYCGGEVAKAIRRGELARPSTFPCADCGGLATEYDHRDYNQPLLVAPVCRGCNARRGKATPRNWSLDELRPRLASFANRQRVVPWALDYCHNEIERTCAAIEEASGISRHELRPDIYGEAHSDARAS